MKKTAISGSKFILFIGICIILFICIGILYYKSASFELFNNPVKPRIAIVLRGHQRNGLDNDELKKLIAELQLTYDIDLYICTWFYIEAKSSHKQLDENNKTKELIISDLVEYFKDFNISTIDVQNDATDCIIHGRTDGKLTDASAMEIIGWKRMLWNMNRGINLINTDIPYKFVLSIRIDYMRLDWMKQNYGFGHTEIIKWINDANTQNIDKITFFKDTEVYGIDNIYIGNISFLKSFLHEMNTKLDEILPEYKNEIAQEYVFYREAMKKVNSAA